MQTKESHFSELAARTECAAVRKPDAATSPHVPRVDKLAKRGLDLESDQAATGVAQREDERINLSKVYIGVTCRSYSGSYRRLGTAGGSRRKRYRAVHH